MASITTTNPANDEILETYKLHTSKQVNSIIDSAHSTFHDWRLTSFDQRAGLMQRAANILEENKERYSKMITDEMGKTLDSAIGEVEKCAWVCRYYADKASEYLADEIIESDAQLSKICYQPLGIILAVMPWNYPFWQVFRFAAPALMGGNVALLKHASNVPGSALFIEEVFRKAGFPKYVFTSLLIKSDQVESILEHKYVKAATLTGSGPAGSAVAAAAGKNIKATVLELGGSDAYIVLEDADIKHAVNQCVASRLLNAGQSCIGAKRFIVVEKVYDEFLELFFEKMSSATMGNPMHGVHLGPMARKDLRAEVHQQVIDSVKKGASLLLGGAIPEGPGAYYPPTILADVYPDMPAYDEEIFGPVASVIKVKDEKEAIHIANDTEFGLGACVFTQDIEKGKHIATYELNAGCCFVNQYVKSDPRLPFGGVKSSGYGRELSYYGIRAFMNVKTVYVK